MIEHKAYLASPPDQLIESMSALALKNGYNVDPVSAGVLIRAPLGQVRIERIGAGGDITFGAASPAELQLLKDLYAGRIANLGLQDALSWQKPDAKAPLNQTLAKVISVTQISPNFARLRLGGDFSPFLRPGAGLHFRMLFGPDGSDWPSLDERGLTRWPGGPDKWHRPPYTVRKMGPDASWIDVDIVLHDGGRVTDWCGAVAPGADIALHGPSGSSQPKATWLGLIGDETALPVMLRIIEDAPAGTSGQAFILVRDPADAQPIKTRGKIDVTWARMNRDDPTAFIRSLVPPTDDFHLFFAAERSEATEARIIFKELGFPSKATKAASYWTK